MHTPVYCSKKLMNLLGSDKIINHSDEIESYMGGWNGHLFAVDGRKCLAFVNNRSYYVIFFADILKKDLKNFSEFFSDRLIQQLWFDKLIDQQQIPLLRDIYSSVSLFRTNNDKRTIGTMNDFIYQFRVHRDYKYESLYEMNLLKENSLINNVPTRVRDGSKSQYSNPKTEIKKLIEACTQSLR